MGFDKSIKGLNILLVSLVKLYSFCKLQNSTYFLKTYIKLQYIIHKKISKTKFIWYTLSRLEISKFIVLKIV